MIWIAIILIIVNICLFVYLKKDFSDKYNENKQLENNNIKLNTIKEELEKNIEEKQNHLNNITTVIKDTQDSFYNSLENYCEVLDNNYNQKEDEYNTLLKKLQNSYEIEQNKYLTQTKNLQKELEDIKKTRAAAQEALRKEKEIQADLSFYCIIPTEEELDDIAALNRIKPKLHQPRILCMLIWSTYFQKPMTALCNQVLGINEVTGIYKITNQETNQCYIGQAVDVAKRWKDHAKCGLGIDTPANNKLYKAIAEYGLQHFSFELLEKCSKDQLDEKERFYIELYQSYEFGYNSNTGNKKY